MLITTQDNFTEYDIVETLGMVKGNTIRARHVGKDILASLRTLVGGEVLEYTKMIAESREQATDRMIADARSIGADAIVCARFTTSPMMQNAAELLAYGTAVKIKRRVSTSF
ncbi:YbjQ family protein [Agarilytica rhodophyticola]|uniref:YbjQ family protein n=1 Tax=Agarilytica rhodophyticola TaxID=1737490 RepID=UPI000B346C28|nr:YbjQ family protein [Agarilytica rhodophyticola]